jgi:PAS domain S-box-containing protein
MSRVQIPTDVLTSFHDETLSPEEQRLQALLAKEQRKVRDLEEEVEKSKAIMKGVSLGILLMTNTFEDCNEEACRLWKCSREDIIGNSPVDFAPSFQPDGTSSKKLVSDKVAAAMAGTPQKFEWRDRCKNGVPMDTEVTLNAVTVQNSTYLVGTIRDITERKCHEQQSSQLLKTMKKVLENERVYRSRIEKDLLKIDLEFNQVFETSSEGLIALDAGGTIVRANNTFSTIVGLQKKDILGRTPRQIQCFAPCGLDTFVVRLLNRKQEDSCTAHITKDDGSSRPYQFVGIPLLGKEKNLLGCIIKLAPDNGSQSWYSSLRTSEELYRVTLKNISDSIFVTDDDGNFYFISPNVQTIFGYTAEEIWWKGNLHHFLGDVYYDEELLRTNGEIHNIELAATTKQGKKLILSVNVKQVDIQGGTVLITCRDITQIALAQQETKLKQEQLVQAGKMVSLGILVSGVAHEINNPNNFIMLNAPLLTRIWSDVIPILDEYQRENGDFFLSRLPYSHARNKILDLFKGIENGSTRIKHIVQELKKYARKDPADQSAPVYLNSAVKHSLALLQSQTRKSTNSLSVHYAKDLPQFQGNFQKIQQVIINLIQNACEALETPSQSISITTGHGPEQVTLLIEDDGLGITPENIPNITDPFFTTKRHFGGTGLGLSISSKIVQEHGGNMIFSSTPGQGTSVKLSFPALSSRNRS